MTRGFTWCHLTKNKRKFKEISGKCHLRKRSISWEITESLMTRGNIAWNPLTKDKRKLRDQGVKGQLRKFIMTWEITKSLMTRSNSAWHHLMRKRKFRNWDGISHLRRMPRGHSARDHLKRRMPGDHSVRDHLNRKKSGGRSVRSIHLRRKRRSENKSARHITPKKKRRLLGSQNGLRNMPQKKRNSRNQYARPIFLMKMKKSITKIKVTIIIILIDTIKANGSVKLSKT